MNILAEIGQSLKKIYRIYSQDLLVHLEDRGFTDLRPSFLEILAYICEHDGAQIKQVGQACGLKKQTMTSHLNELQKRGYIKRVNSDRDRRAQLIKLTEYGEQFKLNFTESLRDLEERYRGQIGQVELERVMQALNRFHENLSILRN